jgi:hypothetical protein
MPKRKRADVLKPPTTRQGNFHQLRPGETARRIEVYGAAYKLAIEQIPALQMREKPDISLRIHASIRRQLKEGAMDPIGIASAALKDALANQ